jgi:pseudaminic acid synthase
MKSNSSDKEKKSFFCKKRVYLIAEISANHGQDLKMALKMIRAAKKAGADAVKFQTYTADTITLDVNNKYFQVKHPKWGGQTLYKLYQDAYTPWSWFKTLKKAANDSGLDFFSTAFDKTAVDFLEDLDVPIHKIASFELVDLPLIQYMAKTKKPMIISTGMGTYSEICDAINMAKTNGVDDIAILKCVSSYPARPEEMNLLTIPDMAKKLKLPIGLSDHTFGVSVPIAAVALGARIIEKHFTLSRRNRTADSFFSLEPQEFQEMAENVRITEAALGKPFYGLTKDQKQSQIYRKSIFVSKNIRKGEVLTAENIQSVRPAAGLPPKYWWKVLGKETKLPLKKGTPLKLKDLK